MRLFMLNIHVKHIILAYTQSFSLESYTVFWHHLQNCALACAEFGLPQVAINSLCAWCLRNLELWQKLLSVQFIYIV